MELDQRGCSVPPRPRANRSREELCGHGKAVFHPTWEWPNIGSRMTRECHVRFWERVGVRLPRATRQLYPRVGFLVTNLCRPPERVVAFYNQRGTAEQWIKEGKNAAKWTRLS